MHNSMVKNCYSFRPYRSITVKFLCVGCGSSTMAKTWSKVPLSCSW